MPSSVKVRSLGKYIVGNEEQSSEQWRHLMHIVSHPQVWIFQSSSGKCYLQMNTNELKISHIQNWFITSVNKVMSWSPPSSLCELQKPWTAGKAEPPQMPPLTVSDSRSWEPLTDTEKMSPSYTMLLLFIDFSSLVQINIDELEKYHSCRCNHSIVCPSQNLLQSALWRVIQARGDSYPDQRISIYLGIQTFSAYYSNFIKQSRIFKIFQTFISRKTWLLSQFTQPWGLDSESDKWKRCKHISNCFCKIQII